MWQTTTNYFLDKQGILIAEMTNDNALLKQMADTMRERIRELEQKLSAAYTQLREIENKTLVTESALSKAMADRESLYDAVRVLAAQVPNTDSAGRSAREAARNLVEGAGLTPPHTLGKSRNRKPVEKPKRRVRKPRREVVLDTPTLPS